MKIKDKVLKEVLKMKWNGKTKEDKLGFGLGKAIDLTLAEVSKGISKSNIMTNFWKKQLKKELGIK